jgi:hypothetical protein
MFGLRKPTFIEYSKGMYMSHKHNSYHNTFDIKCCSSLSQEKITIEPIDQTVIAPKILLTRMYCYCLCIISAAGVRGSTIWKIPSISQRVGRVL